MLNLEMSFASVVEVDVKWKSNVVHMLSYFNAMPTDIGASDAKQNVQRFDDVLASLSSSHKTGAHVCKCDKCWAPFYLRN